MMKLARALLVTSWVATGCGDGPTAPVDPDAVAVDADLSPDAAVAGTVTMTVIDDGAPVAGQPVIFYQADGTLVANLVTDAAGQAAAELLAGGTVVVIDTVGSPGPAGDAAVAMAYLGVRPGDDLRFGVAASPPETTLSTTLTVPAYAGADEYVFNLGCGRTATSATPTATFSDIRCTASTPLFVQARFGTELLATIYVPAQPLAADVNVTGPFRPATAATVTATGVPAVVANALIGAHVSTPEWVGLSEVFLVDGGTPVGGAVSAMGPLPDLGTGAQMVLHFQERSGFLPRLIYRAVAPAATVTIDGEADLPPWLGGALFDLETGEFTWTAVGDGRIDYAFGYLSASHADGSDYYWYVHGDVPSLSFRLPELPAEFAALQAQPTDTVDRTDCIFVNADAPRLDLLRREFAMFFAEFGVLPAAGGYVAMSGNI